MHERTFPTIFHIAIDYLPIQASAVPCERVFSSSAETDTKKQDRISPALMEALQILKFSLKKDHLISSTFDIREYLSTDDGPSSAGSLMEMLKLKPDQLKAFLDVVSLVD